VEADRDELCVVITLATQLDSTGKQTKCSELLAPVELSRVESDLIGSGAVITPLDMSFGLQAKIPVSMFPGVKFAINELYNVKEFNCSGFVQKIQK